MVLEFRLPELGEGVTSADVVKVLVAPGQEVAAEAPLFEVETGKAAMEIPAPAAGKVVEVLVEAGGKVAPGDLVLRYEPAAGEAAAEPAPPAEAAEEPARPAAAPAPARPTAGEPPQAAAPPAQARPSPAPAGGPVSAAPSVRRFAREIGVDVTLVPGSGPGGRISAEDVKRFAREGRAVAPASPAAAPLSDLGRYGPVRREPMSNVRKATAKVMAAAWSAVPHVTLHRLADLTAVEEFRRAYGPQAAAAGAKLTPTAILLKFVAAALRAHPVLNAAVDLAAEEVVWRDSIHLGVAVDTPRGLMVPVIRDADTKGILDLARELGALSAKAREGKLTLEEMAGATFTVTNLGGMGVEHFSPIVTPPQVGVLGVGAARDHAVAAAGGWQARRLLPLSLAFDHRLVDGADGARFLGWLGDALASPLMLALEG